MTSSGSQLITWLSCIIFFLKLVATQENNFKVKTFRHDGSYEERAAKQYNSRNFLKQEAIDERKARHSQNNDLQGDFKTRISQLSVNDRELKGDLGETTRPENFTRRKFGVPQNAILVLQVYFSLKSFTNDKRQRLVAQLADGLGVARFSCFILHVVPVGSRQSLVEVACKNRRRKMSLQYPSGHEDLIPAHDIVRALDWPTMKPLLQEFNVTAFGVKDLSQPELAVYQEMWFPVALVCGVSILIVILAIICLLLCRRRLQENDEEDGKASKLDPETQLRYPSVPIKTVSASMIQPEAEKTYSLPGQAGKLHTYKRSQLSLYDRRGSKASLVLDLKSSPSETASLSSTSYSIKESPTEEKLASKSKVVGYNDLEECLNDLKQLHEEFWELPINYPLPEERIPGSGYRNRYQFILPNSKSRVRLPEVPEDPLSSYINANFIKGYNGEPDVFIATQGPLSCTVKDFWRMIWYMHCPIVVMITKLKERNKTKCERYWPDPTFKMQEKYGDIEVTFDSAIGRDGYQITSLFVNHSQSSEAPRRLYHYWYTAWPDHDTPESPSQLLQLVEEVHMALERDNTEKGPVVVHCSAGVGRTGCFIAASIGSRQIQKEDRVDILKIVSLMRIDRGGMVENDSQYVFIHRALFHYWRNLRSVSSSEEEDEARDVVLDALYE